MIDMRPETLPRIEDDVVFVNAAPRCDMNGAACYNQAHRSWSTCGTCGYMPEYGLMQKAQLCCACIHEGFQERQQKDSKATEPCRCHVSLWWWDHEYDRRLEWLRLNNPGFVEKVKMRPARVSTDAAHQAPQVNAAASTDQQPWRADVRVDAPVPNGPQSACRTAASCDLVIILWVVVGGESIIGIPHVFRIASSDAVYPPSYVPWNGVIASDKLCLACIHGGHRAQDEQRSQSLHLAGGRSEGSPPACVIMWLFTCDQLSKDSTCAHFRHTSRARLYMHGIVDFVSRQCWYGAQGWV